MRKIRNIIYWVSTIWLALGMLSTGVVQLMHVKAEVDMFSALGYPGYLLNIIGIWKLLGVVVILIRRYALVKEWAYSGFFFVMTGAVISHVLVGDPVRELFGPVLLIILTVVSWYSRPPSRKITLSSLIN